MSPLTRQATFRSFCFLAVSKTVELQYLEFVIWKEKFIVDSNKLTKGTNKEECIGAETATSMMCHQPNMEFVRPPLPIFE